VNTHVFFEAAGARNIIPDVINLARFQAKLVVVAVYHEPVPVNFQSALAKEMSFITSMAYPNEFPTVISMLTNPAYDPTPMISHRFSFDAFFEAFEMAQDRENSAKVLVTFPE
jgi:(R,R)-butanediol dehydrogenase / meso-butanediol dehydrogenase / diacetyl reductase